MARIRGHYPPESSNRSIQLFFIMVRLANRCRRVFHTNHLHLGLFFHLLSTPPPFQSDEEPVCQKPIIEAHCEHHHCEEKVNLYKACQERVVAKGSGHCEGYAFDLWHCIDHCVSSCMRCPVIHVPSEHICVATVVSLFPLSPFVCLTLSLLGRWVICFFYCCTQLCVVSMAMGTPINAGAISNIQQLKVDHM